MEPLNTLPKHNLFGLENQDYKTARVVVLPVPYDSATTYGSGARNGPSAIIEASRHIELFSYELKKDISKIGIYTTDEIAPNLGSPELMAKQIKKEVELIIEDGKIPLLLGGDHSITIGAIAAYKAVGRKISVLYFDAHSDSRNEIFGSRHTHASVAARIKDMYYSITWVGVRSIDERSFKKINRSSIVYADQITPYNTELIAAKIRKRVKGDIYISIDLDVLDPSEMPSVGTPEPGGMSFSTLSDIITRVARGNKLAGMDITELSPIGGIVYPNYTAAKLAGLALGSFF